MKKTYVKQINVSSETNPEKSYKVSLCENGEYECSCRKWTTTYPREDCKHIVGVRSGEYDGMEETPKIYNIIPANVGQVKKVDDVTFHVPLIPFSAEGNPLFVTIVYDLIKFGVPMRVIRERYKNLMPKTWTKELVDNYCFRNGRFVYTAFRQGHGWTDGKWVFPYPIPENILDTVKVEYNSNFILLADVEKRYSVSMGTSIMITPDIDENYWLFRVKVSENQAIVAFNKFNTIGIGFQIEAKDWNTNLPFLCSAEEIYEHIKVNKGDKSIPKERCLLAIMALQKIAWDRREQSVID